MLASEEDDMRFGNLRISRFLTATLAMGVAVAGTIRADDVILVNGNVFEDVIVAAQTDEQIRLRLPFGELALPSAQVARIVRSTSPLETFLERREALLSSDAPPEDWLELAQWAEGSGLDYGYRDIVHMLAKRSPHLAGLAPHISSLGYELDSDIGAWVRPRSSQPAPRPLPPREPAPERPADRPAERAADRAAERAEHERSTTESLSRAVELMAEAELARETRTTAPRVQPFFVQTVPVWPGVVWTGWSFPPAASSEPPPPADPNPSLPVVHRPANPEAMALLRRQPGSLISVDTLAR